MTDNLTKPIKTKRVQNIRILHIIQNYIMWSLEYAVLTRINNISSKQRLDKHKLLVSIESINDKAKQNKTKRYRKD